MSLVHQTKSELALVVLRQRILTGEAPAGTKLDINELAAEFSMSQTPIREALKVLQSDRLVHYRPHVGTVVAGLSEEALAEIFLLRVLLEPAAVEVAVARLEPATLDELEALHQSATRDIADVEASVFSERNRAWHWHLYNAADSPYVADFIRRVWDAFPWRAIASLGGRRDRSVAEHDAIMEAVRRGDGPGAAQRMREHIESSREAMRIGSPARSLDGTATALETAPLEPEHADGR